MTGQRSTEPTKAQLRCQEQQHFGKHGRIQDRPLANSMEQGQRFQDVAEDIRALSVGCGLCLHNINIERRKPNKFWALDQTAPIHYTVNDEPDYTQEQAITLAFLEVVRVDAKIEEVRQRKEMNNEL